MDKRELERLIAQYKEAYPEPGPFEVADVVARLERALNTLPYLRLQRTRSSHNAAPMIEAKAVFNPSMRPAELACEDVAGALAKGFDGAPTFKVVMTPLARGAEYLILARSRPEAPVDATFRLEAA
jgi:hypothetical protein